MKVCSKCKGNKKIMGLGFMKQKCPVCLGLGYLVPQAIENKVEKPAIISPDNRVEVPESPKRKRGRPKKVD